MVFSMTGYGRYEITLEDAQILVEMRSVNHRFNEVSIRMPRELYIYEDAVRKKVLNHIRRGRIDVFITLEAQTQSSLLQVNWDLANQYYAISQEMGDKFQLAGELSLKDMMSLPEVVQVQESETQIEKYQGPLLQGVEQAAILLKEMRQKEGEALSVDLLKRMRYMKGIVDYIKGISSKVADFYREKISQRVREYIGNHIQVDEGRLLNEVAIFSEKADITEELTRLDSHFSQFAHILQEDEPIGRKLDFLVQECHREINTIGSKANDLEISQQVILLKSELEKVKEQVQNIE
ncbi:MAG TPA: YicC family protein [Paenibacillaceae bacterium]|nr:YicC family protein [Paenibacillaceae bacterium]